MDQALIAQLAPVQTDIVAADPTAQGMDVEEILFQMVHLHIDFVRIIIVIKIEKPVEFLKILDLFKVLGHQGGTDKTKEDEAKAFFHVWQLVALKICNLFE